MIQYFLLHKYLLQKDYPILYPLLENSTPRIAIFLGFILVVGICLCKGPFSWDPSFHCILILFYRFLLKALDMYWHEDCLKCGCCDCRLGEVGSTLYTKGNLLLCRRDYLRYVSYTHSMSSSCKFSTKEIWAAFFRQTFWAESD